MSIVFLGLLAYLGYSIYSKGYFRFQPEGKRYQKNSELVQEYLLNQQPLLVDFGADELELLSGNKQKDKSRSLFKGPAEGVLLSIYHEPFIAYKAIYHSNDLRTGVIGIATNKDQYVYIMKKDHVDIFFNKKPMGTIKGNGQLVSTDSKRTLASYVLKTDTFYQIRIDDRPEAEVKVNIEAGSLPQRMIDVYGPADAATMKMVQIMAFYLVGLGIKS